MVAFAIVAKMIIKEMVKNQLKQMLPKPLQLALDLLKGKTGNADAQGVLDKAKNSESKEGAIGILQQAIDSGKYGANDVKLFQDGIKALLGASPSEQPTEIAMNVQQGDATQIPGGSQGRDILAQQDDSFAAQT